MLKWFGNTLFICLLVVVLSFIVRPWATVKADYMMIRGLDGYYLSGWRGKNSQFTQNISVGKPGPKGRTIAEIDFTEKEIRQLTSSSFETYQMIGHMLDNMWYNMEDDEGRHKRDAEKDK